MKSRQLLVGPLSLLVLVAGCEAILGIEQGRLRTFCSGKPEGTPLPEQLEGDCLEFVCDGQGDIKQNPSPSDADDDNPCTVDSCNGSTPVHTKQAVVDCYSGPEGTKGRGVCKGGTLQCDEQGNPKGKCEGETLPDETDSIVQKNDIDDDCDGQVDEDPDCGDGIVQPELGEECDDGGTADGDPCSPTCKEQRVLALSAGTYHTCALLSGGVVKCWGFNFSGQLGLGDKNNRGANPNEMGSALPAVDLGGGRHALKIACGGTHTCVILDDQTLKCWGENFYGQLGLGDMENRGGVSNQMGDALPAVSLGSEVVSFALAAGKVHTCVLFTNGNAKCWGGNYIGQLGLGDKWDHGGAMGEMGDALLPVDLGPGNVGSEVAAGDAHTCVLFNGGNIKCWGDNLKGQLGLGDKLSRGYEAGQMGSTLKFVDLGTGNSSGDLARGKAYLRSPGRR